VHGFLRDDRFLSKGQKLSQGDLPKL
jgi:hypothetical protein